MKKIYKTRSHRAAAIQLLIMLLVGTLHAQMVTQTFSYTGTVQTFTVPTICGTTVVIDARGAEGGNNVTLVNMGGKGARMIGTFTATPGQVFNIVVGQKGFDNTGGNVANGAGGGGGGSFVWLQGATVPMIAAGGGGASCLLNNGLPNYLGKDASITTTATGSRSHDAFGNSPGGVNGLNGQTVCGSGGKGWIAILSNPAGNPSGNVTYGAAGGYGGGGGGGTSPNIGNTLHTGGGGGGYSGGGAGGSDYYHGGGGGGSFNAGTNQVNTGTVQSGNGLVSITYNAGTTVSVSANPPGVCIGSSSTITATGVVSYTWSNSTIASSIVVNPISNTTYTVQGTNSLGCVTSAVITLSANSTPPSLTLSLSSNTVCLGRTATITANGAITYTWTGGIINGQTFTPSITSSYTVLGQNGCGTSSAVTSISVSPIPISVLATPSLVCEGYPSTLTAVAAATGFTWSPVSLYTSSIIVAPLSNTIYTISVGDGTCSGTQTLAVATKVTPTITAATTATMICQGNSVILTAGGGSSYNWTPGNLSGQSVTVSPSISTLYQLTGTNSVGCSNFTAQGIVVTATPTVNIVANKTTVCAGEVVNLFASGANSYQWAGGPGTSGYTVNPTTSTVYTVTGTQTGNVCTGSKTIAITAVVSNVSVSSNTSVCPGGSTTLIATGATSYVWNGIPQLGNGNFPVTPNAPTVYTVVATTSSNSINCPVTKTVQVGIYPTPTITIVPTKTLICKAQSNTLTASGAVTYSWGAAGSGSVIVVKPNNTTIYTATGIDANGCEGTQLISVVVNACSGLQESEGDNTGVSIFPNPNTGEFTLQTNSDVVLKLLNNLGQEIRVITLTENNHHSVDVKDLANGIYFIVGEMVNVKINKKIVVTK